MLSTFSDAPEISQLSFNAEEFLEGDFAQSNCVLRKGDKPIVISWLFNGLPLTNSEDVEIVKMGSRSSILTIEPVTGQNQGNYTCVASNPAGSMAVHTVLKVNGTYNLSIQAITIWTCILFAE